MGEDQLDTAAFVFFDEMKAWKAVKFEWNNHAAVNAFGEIVMFTSEDKLASFVKRRAVSALLKFYHEEQAKTPFKGAPQ